jgi:hypothetical protein
MKKWIMAGAVLLLAAAALYFFLNPHKKPVAPPYGSAAQIPPAPPENPVRAASGSSAGGNPASGSTSPVNLAANAGEVPPPPAANPDFPPAIVLDNVRLAVRQYRDRFGGNPVGINPEITAALNGDNPRQINFIKPEAGMRLNESGELVDPWGTPLFFHQLSGTDMEIRSAGPDRKLWDLDDLVTK